MLLKANCTKLINTVNKNITLAEKVRNDRGVKKVIIVPVVVTIEGTISRFTIQKLIDCEINIKWLLIIRELLIKQMKDILFYLNHHLNGIELEQGTLISIKTNEIPNEDVSQNDPRN